MGNWHRSARRWSSKSLSATTCARLSDRHLAFFGGATVPADVSYDPEVLEAGLEEVSARMNEEPRAASVDVAGADVEVGESRRVYELDVRATMANDMLTTYLRRGMLAGLLAGLFAGLFAFFVGEPSVDQAIQLEEAASSGPHEEVFSRTTQKVGLFVVTGLSGMLVGGLFGLAFAYFRERLASNSDWLRSLSLAAAIFTAAVLVPFLKYPANPPAVGDPATIGARTAAYFALVGLSLLAILVAWRVSGLLRERGTSDPVRHTVVSLRFVLIAGILCAALPSAAGLGDFPAGLLWERGSPLWAPRSCCGPG